MQAPIYSAEEEQALMAHLWSPEIADDPYKFVMTVFPWGKEGTPLHKFKGPRRWQIGVLESIRDHIEQNKQRQRLFGTDDVLEALRDATSSGRGIGKSALVAWLILWMLSTRIGASVIVSANSESQLKSVTWGELSKWVAMALNSHWWDLSATKLTPAQWLTSIVERDLKKGTRYWSAEGKLWSEENPDSYAGAHNHDGMMVVFDESSGIPNPIWDVAAGYFTEPTMDRYWLAFSNPRRNTGYFYECFHGRRNFWKTRQIDSRTVEGTDKAIYQQIIDEHGEDSYQARVEVMGEFPSQGDDQFIDSASVDGAMKREAYEDETAPIVIGVDVARFGSDKTAIAVRKGRDLIALYRYTGIDTMQTVGKVIEMMGRYSPDLTVIDEGGLGAGVLDRLLEQRYKVRGINFGNRADNSTYGNKRSEIWGAMREWLKTASVKDDKELRTDMLAPTYKLNSTGAIMLESKDAMKKRGAASPDAADAIAITFSYPVARRGGSQPLVVKRRSRGPQITGTSSGAWMN